MMAKKVPVKSSALVAAPVAVPSMRECKQRPRTAQRPPTQVFLGRRNESWLETDLLHTLCLNTGLSEKRLQTT